MDQTERLLACVDELFGLDDPAQLPTALARPLHRLIPYDFLVYNEINTATGQIVTISEPTGVETKNAVFEEFAYQHPLLTHYQRTRDPSVLRLSDHIGRAQFHRLELYNDFLRLFGIEHEIVCTVPAIPSVAIGLVLTRDCKDFSTEECEALGNLRPHLIHAYRAARRYAQLKDQVYQTESVYVSSRQVERQRLRGFGLTEREADILTAVADGDRNKVIARRYGITERTVKKHLENIYEKLGVDSRTAALARLRAS